MIELNIAGNRVLSFQIDEDDLIPYKLRVDGYESFQDTYDETIDSGENRFKTPEDFDNPLHSQGYQYYSKNSSLMVEYKEYINKLINNELGSNLKVDEVWYLKQTTDAWVDNPKHVHMTAEWVCVMYIDVKPGDAIQFFDSADNMESYEPTVGEIIFFPSNAVHRPAHNVSTNRLTINAELSRINISEVEAEAIKNRLNVCKGCDKYNTELYMCSECACYIPMKISMSSEECPLGKWIATTN